MLIWVAKNIYITYFNHKGEGVVIFLTRNRLASRRKVLLRGEETRDEGREERNGNRAERQSRNNGTRKANTSKGSNEHTP